MKPLQILIGSVVLACAPLLAFAHDTAESAVFAFLQFGIVNPNEAELTKLLADPMTLLDGKTWPRVSTVRDLSGYRSRDSVEVRITTINFIRNKNDLTALFESWAAMEPKRPPPRKEDATIDLERACRGMPQLLVERKTFVKCVIAFEARPRAAPEQATRMLMFVLCEQRDGKWMITGVDDG